MADLRPRGADDLGLRRAVPDRMLPFLVGAMAFLGALALAGMIAASGLAQRWQAGAGAALVVQVPDEGNGRAERVLTMLRGTPGVVVARALDAGELQDLLRPWLGAGSGRIALPLPAVIEVRLQDNGAVDTDALGVRLAAAVPGTLVENTDAWAGRLALLARSVQACAALVMAMVGVVAVAVVAVATRAGLSARRDAVEIVHELGASDGYVAARFANRAMRLAALGAAAGTLLALPVVVGLAVLASPFVGPGTLSVSIPPALWLAIPAMPLVAALIGWGTAQATVRRWLRRLV